MKNRFLRGTPGMNNSPEFSVVPEVIRETPALGKQRENGCHVRRDLGRNIPKLRRIESAEACSIPPAEQKISGHSTLTRPGLCNPNQSFQSSPFPTWNMSLHALRVHDVSFSSP
jgi:hypothetical protein